ncbi:MAG: hypothetical protein ACYC9J_10110 [Sulfuricaulis sp.]
MNRTITIYSSAITRAYRQFAYLFGHIGQKIVLITAAVFSLTIATNVVYAAPGDLDPTFGINGVATTTSGIGLATGIGQVQIKSLVTFTKLAVQSDGKIVAAGIGSSYIDSAGNPHGGSSMPFLIRYNSDGSLDNGFGIGGIVITALYDVRDQVPVAVQGDGKILTALPFLTRFSTGGVFEASFVINNFLSGENGITTIVIQSDGKILVVGAGNVARYNSDGTPDSSFGTGGVIQGLFRDVGLQSDGKIVAAGGAFGLIIVSRFNADGTPDSSFGSNGTAFVIADPNNNGSGALSVSIQPDGKIITASEGVVNCTGSGGAGCSLDLRRFNADGTLDTTFGSGGLSTAAFSGDNGYGLGTALQGDGKILVVGNRSTFVARYNPDGSPDSQFGPVNALGSAVIGFVSSVVLQADGKILTAGAGPVSGGGGATVWRIMADNSPLLFPTPVGSNVNVALGNGVTVTYSAVTAAGDTSVTTSPTGPTLPAGFQTGNPAIYYDITTTANYTPPIQVCITYDPAGYTDPTLARLFHYEGGAWTDVTTSNDTVNYILCGQTTSLSPFVILVPPPYQGQIQPPINSDGSSVFAANRGVVPVKFTLSSGGQATCTLPTATIAVSQVTGTTDQPISESVYTMAADNGSYYRISGCQYLYNLNAKALSQGTYLVQVLINNAIVGSATFGLK